MTDELQPLLSEPLPEIPPIPAISPDVITPQPKKSNKNLWIIVGIVLGLLCLCSIICVVAIVLGVGKVGVERAPVEAVLDAYMKSMAAKDIEGAYALFSPRAQRQFLSSDLQELTEGNNYYVFKGYQSLEIQIVNINAAVNVNPDVPQGTIANVTAIVSYDAGFTGSISAVLEKVDGTWMLHAINVTVPPDKFQP
jgi:hypothetical protein